MFPGEELKSLATSKAALRQRIMARRSECAAAAARLAQPIAWIGRAHEGWRLIAHLFNLPSAPVGFLTGRMKNRHLLTTGAVLRWGPLVLGAVRALSPHRSPSRRG
jgi:hypothetical protein